MNKNKKILTISDLVRFFEEKQLQTFSSKDSGYKLAVQIPAELKFDKNEDLTNEDMMYVMVKVMHDGINRNNSMITTENLMKAAPSIKYRPILANFKEVKDENGDIVKDFTSHDFIINSDGIIEYQEKQVGCFTADEPYLVYDEDKDRNFLMARAAIPIGYTDTADIIERKNGTKVSVELSISDCAFSGKEKCLELKTFYISGCTLLAEDVGEGMLGARLDIDDISDFSESNNSLFSSNKNSETNTKLIETLEKLDKTLTTLSNFNINQTENSVEENSEEGGKEEVNKFEELLKKYNKTAEDIDFEVEGLTDEELEAKFAEVFGEETSDEDPASEECNKVEDSDEDKTEDENQEENQEENTSTQEEMSEENNDESDENSDEEKGSEDNEDDSNNSITDTNACGGGSGSKKKKKKKNELNSSVIKYSVESNGNTKTYEVSLDEKIYAIQDLVNLTYSESDNTYYGVKVYEDYVIMVDYWSGRAYRQSYSEEEDSYTLTGDRVEVYSVWVTAEEEAALNEMKANYASLAQFKADTENAQLHTQREAILYDEKYSVLAEKDENNEYKNEAYAKLVSEMDNYSLADLEKELKSVFADYITNGGQFAYTGKPDTKSMVSKKLFTTPTGKKSSRYGNLFNK